MTQAAAQPAPRIEAQGGGSFRVSGPLTFATVRDVLRISKAEFAKDAPKEIELSRVTAADSAGLSLLIEWYRDAAREQRTLKFIGAPPAVCSLAKISELDQLLGLQA